MLMGSTVSREPFSIFLCYPADKPANEMKQKPAASLWAGGLPLELFDLHIIR